MITKKKIIITAFSLFGLFLVFFFVLIVHVAIVVKDKKPVENSSIQMARIDFEEFPNEILLTKLLTEIKMQKGIKDFYFNKDSRIFIYTFDATKNKGQTIYDKVISNSFKAKYHLLKKNEENSGCPAVIDNNSFFGRISYTISSIIY